MVLSAAASRTRGTTWAIAALRGCAANGLLVSVMVVVTTRATRAAPYVPPSPEVRVVPLVVAALAPRLDGAAAAEAVAAARAARTIVADRAAIACIGRFCSKSVCYSRSNFEVALVYSCFAGSGLTEPGRRPRVPLPVPL